MRSKTTLFILAALTASSMFGQQQDSESHMPVTLGFKVGIPVTDMLDASNTTEFNGNTLVPGSAFSAAVPRYEFGVSGEFHLPYHLRFEVDGLFKRGGFATSGAFNGGSGIAYTNTKFNVFEVPGLFKYNVSLGHFRPFVDFGASLRHIAGFQTTDTLPGLANSFINDSPTALRNRNSYGGVAGFGITFKKGPFELTPEARYTRWANESFTAMGLRTNLDQGDILLGISF